MLFTGRSRTPLLKECVACVPVTSLSLPPDSPLYGPEPLVLAAVLVDPPFLPVVLPHGGFLDNNDRSDAFFRGVSNTAVTATLVTWSWQLVSRFEFHVWFSRVRPKPNSAGLPTRERILPFVINTVASQSQLRNTLVGLKHR